ncbi:MAG: hypothetical protein RO009_20170 [Pseudorhodoplanes sp.]|jgi:hypothetical protein|nr:hypothetical protein [Pseudorhodoplanes sp.]
MDSLHGVLRAIRQPAPRRDHLSVFREFLNHLDRIGRGKTARDVKALRNGKGKSRRGKS